MSKNVFHTTKAGNITIRVNRCTQKKKGKDYVFYSVPHYVGGKRAWWANSDPELAVLKADELAAGPYARRCICGGRITWPL